MNSSLTADLPKHCPKCGQYPIKELPVANVTCICSQYIITEPCGAESVVYSSSAQAAALDFALEYNNRDDDQLVSEELNIKVNDEEFTISASKTIHFEAFSADTGHSHASVDDC